MPDGGFWSVIAQDSPVLAVFGILLVIVVVAGVKGVKQVYQSLMDEARSTNEAYRKHLEDTARDCRESLKEITDKNTQAIEALTEGLRDLKDTVHELSSEFASHREEVREIAAANKTRGRR